MEPSEFFASKVFHDRADAGRQLAVALEGFRSARPAVLVLPRGGVPVAYEVARTLEAPLDLVLVRKIGTPWQPELAIAAVVDGGRPETVVMQDLVDRLNIPRSYIEKQAAIELEELERRRSCYLAERPRVDIADRTARPRKPRCTPRAAQIRIVSSWSCRWPRRILSADCVPRSTMSSACTARLCSVPPDCSIASFTSSAMTRSWIF
jgi:putative phosphoribosyl transferase